MGTWACAGVSRQPNPVPWVPGPVVFSEVFLDKPFRASGEAILGTLNYFP